MAGASFAVLLGNVPISLFIPAATGTVIGDMTARGGIAAAFDGTTVQALAVSADAGGITPQTGYVGKDWGAGNAKTITRFLVYAPSNSNLAANNTGTVSLALYGSNTAPATPTNGTLLASVGPFTNGVAPHVAAGVGDFGTGITFGAFRYSWVWFSANSNNEVCVVEVQFWGY